MFGGSGWKDMNEWIFGCSGCKGVSERILCMLGGSGCKNTLKVSVKKDKLLKLGINND